MKKIRTNYFLQRRVGNLLSVTKLAMLFLLTVSFTIQAKALGQRTTIRLNNVNLQVVFNEIKQKMGYTFVYNDQVVRNAGKISVDVTSSDIKQMLSIKLCNLYCSYSWYLIS